MKLRYWRESLSSNTVYMLRLLQFLVFFIKRSTRWAAESRVCLSSVEILHRVPAVVLLKLLRNWGREAFVRLLTVSICCTHTHTHTHACTHARMHTRTHTHTHTHTRMHTHTHTRSLTHTHTHTHTRTHTHTHTRTHTHAHTHTHTLERKCVDSLNYPTDCRN